MLGKLNDTQIEEVLANNVLGRIGCHDDGRTYIVPINYVYDGKNIIAHSTPGMKIQMMRHNPQVCFEVDEMIDFSNWKSVIVYGTFEELGKSEANKGLEIIMEKLKKEKNITSVKSYCIWGVASEEILKFTKDNNIDMIVMGTGKRLKGISKIGALGSVTRKVSELANCPVLIVH